MVEIFVQEGPTALLAHHLPKVALLALTIISLVKIFVLLALKVTFALVEQVIISILYTTAQQDIIVPMAPNIPHNLPVLQVLLTI